MSNGGTVFAGGRRRGLDARMTPGYATTRFSAFGVSSASFLGPIDRFRRDRLVPATTRHSSGEALAASAPRGCEDVPLSFEGSLAVAAERLP